MVAYQESLMDEVRRGNYTAFVRYVLNQIPSEFRVDSLEARFLNENRDYLVSIGADLVGMYCAVMSSTGTDFFKDSNCVNVLKEYWQDFITDADRDEYWVKMSIHMLKLFNANVGIAALVTMPMHLSLLAMLRAIGDGKPIDQLVNIINILGKLSILVSVFYAEMLINLLVGSIGTSAFMMLVNHFAEELIKAYSNAVQ